MPNPKNQGKARAARSQQEHFVGRTLHYGDYTIQKVLGRGGMGQVFLASHKGLAIPLALKQGRIDRPVPESVLAELNRTLYGNKYDEEGDGGPPPFITSQSQQAEYDFPSSGGVQTDRFVREALLLARLHHLALPALYDYFFEDGYWYLVMDYLPGSTLGTYLRSYTPLPPLEALNYTMQLCDVLEYLHKQLPPVIFRDLKPANIILTPDGRAMLVDFGIARYFKMGQGSDTADFGSPGYAAPEQYGGSGQTDGRSDLYSLGIILYEMLSGQRPVGEEKHSVSLRRLNPSVSTVLSGLVDVAIHPKPLYRFQSAHSFFHALERTYLVEERRAYQQYLLEAQNRSKLGLPAVPDHASESNVQRRKETTHVLPPWHLHAAETQTAQIRETLQMARRERLEQGHGARKKYHHNELSDATTPLLGVPLGDTLPEATRRLPPARLPARRARLLLRTGFRLSLVLLVVLTAFFVTTHFFRPSSVVPPSQQPQSTSTPTPTSTTVLSSSWQVLPSLPSQEADNALAYVQIQGRGYLYMSGGYRGQEKSLGYRFPYSRGLYRYDIAAAHWELLLNPRVPRFPIMVNNAVAVEGQNTLFFTAGYSPDLNSVLSVLYKYQLTNGATETLQKIVPSPPISIGFASAMISDQQGHLFITQGLTQAGNSHTAAGTGWYRYDIASGQWHVLAPLPTGLGYAVLAPDGNEGLFLFGGSIDAGQQLQNSQVYRYDLLHNTWLTEPIPAPVTLSGAASCLDGHGHSIFVGGYDAIHGQALGQTWLVDLHTLAWTRLTSLPIGGSLLGAAACDSNGHVFLERGASDPNHPTSDFWLLQLTITGG